MALSKSGMYKKHGHAFNFQFAHPFELKKRWVCPFCGEVHGLIGTMNHICFHHKVACVCTQCEVDLICYNPHTFLNHIERHHREYFETFVTENIQAVQKRMLLLMLGNADAKCALSLLQPDILRNIAKGVMLGSVPFQKRKGKWTSTREERDQFMADRILDLNMLRQQLPAYYR
jgi:hypothetical protein